MTEFWIEKGWGVSIDNAEIADAVNAVEEIRKRYDENSVFWIGHIQEEYVLKIHKDMSMLYIYGENQDKELVVVLEEWSQAEHFIKMYFSKDFLGIKEQIKLFALNKKINLT
ncbi:hypothetical protein [uncultured Flavobacterium sp.]|uniref:hypothetical protein n=1 Tax=uncultured Flavobacterium sp. TaxID=165435 RepID=UPI0025FFC2C7|nr:hypothetical protein [uncultured Flavobacterium sp.]